MLFTSVGGYMFKKNTEVIICFILFWKHRSYNLFHFIFTNFPIVPMAAMWNSRPISIKFNSKFKMNSKMLFPSVGVYMYN